MIVRINLISLFNSTDRIVSSWTRYKAVAAEVGHKSVSLAPRARLGIVPFRIVIIFARLIKALLIFISAWSRNVAATSYLVGIAVVELLLEGKSECALAYRMQWCISSWTWVVEIRLKILLVDDYFIISFSPRSKAICQISLTMHCKSASGIIGFEDGWDVIGVRGGTRVYIIKIGGSIQNSLTFIYLHSLTLLDLHFQFLESLSDAEARGSLSSGRGQSVTYLFVASQLDGWEPISPAITKGILQLGW